MIRNEDEEEGYWKGGKTARMAGTPVAHERGARQPPPRTRSTLLKQHTVSGTWQDSDTDRMPR